MTDRRPDPWASNPAAYVLTVLVLAAAIGGAINAARGADPALVIGPLLACVPAAYLLTAAVRLVRRLWHRQAAHPRTTGADVGSCAAAVIGLAAASGAAWVLASSWPMWAVSVLVVLSAPIAAVGALAVITWVLDHCRGGQPRAGRDDSTAPSAGQE